MEEEVISKLEKAFQDVSFFEEGHRYVIKNFEDKPVKSVSSLLSYFYDSFDSSKIAPKYAKVRGFTEEQVLKAWAGEGLISTDHGTKVHLHAENYALFKYFNKGECPNPFDKQSLGAMQFLNDLPSHLVPVKLELSMFNIKYWYVGTADVILLNKKNGKLVIADYKGLPLDTPILTDKGWCNNGDLTINHRVFDIDGNLCNIMNISQVHKKKCYKIIFDTGEEIISDIDHRWLVFNEYDNKEEVVTTKEIYDKIDYSKVRNHYLSINIKNTAPLSIADSDLEIDPYLLGIWVGTQLKGKEVGLDNVVLTQLEKMGHLKSHSTEVHAHSLGINLKLKELGITSIQSIPNNYLKSSTLQRLALLRGIMDIQGIFDKYLDAYVLKNVTREQMPILIYLIASLGMKVKNDSTTFSDDAKEVSKDIIFYYNEFNPFLIKKDYFSSRPMKSRAFRHVVDVVPVEDTFTRCIEVSSPTSTYLAGLNLIPTHNTNKSLIDDSKDVMHIVPAESGLKQDNLGKYSLQFSFYQILLEEAGFEVQGRVLVWLKDNPEKYSTKLYQTFKTPDVTKSLRLFLETKEHEK